MSSDKDESYWIGVRDALRMVDSFLKWSRRNPSIAKTLDEFLAEGLVAAAKRCESCLGRELGLKYGKEDPEKGIDESFFEDEMPDETSDLPTEGASDLDAEIADAHEDAWDDDTPLIPPSEAELADSSADEPLPADASVDEHTLIDALSDAMRSESREGPSTSTELANEESPKPTFIDSMESKITGGPADDLDYDTEPGEFTSDFELAEPEPLIIEPEDGEDEESIDVPSIQFEEPDLEEPPPSETMESDKVEAVEESISFETTPPESEDLQSGIPEDSDDTFESSSESLVSADAESAVSSLAEIWSPYDEPSISDEELAADDNDLPPEPPSDDEDIEEEQSAPRKVPPPPPPPETDETEEERRKRARRLFFGA